MSYSKPLFNSPSSSPPSIYTINTINNTYIINNNYSIYIVKSNTNIILPSINLHNGLEINILNEYTNTINITSINFSMFNTFFAPSSGITIFELVPTTYIKLNYYNQKWYIISS